MKISMALNSKSIDLALRELEKYEDRIQKCAEEIVRILSLRGYDVAYTIMAGNVYSGETLDSLTIVEESPTKHILTAGSKALLFFEFGAGVQGVGHPLAGDFGMGAGTYPPTNPEHPHWNDPDGWWYPTDDPGLIVRHGKDGQGYGHTHGNPPRMPMYMAAKTIRDELLDVVKEVINGD